MLRSSRRSRPASSCAPGWTGSSSRKASGSIRETPCLHVREPLVAVELQGAHAPGDQAVRRGPQRVGADAERDERPVLGDERRRPRVRPRQPKSLVAEADDDALVLVGPDGGADQVDRRGAQERRDEDRGRVVVDLLGRADVLQDAAAQDRDAVGEGQRLDLVVRDVERRHAERSVRGRRSPSAARCAGPRRGSTGVRPSGRCRAAGSAHGPSRRAGAGHRTAWRARGEGSPRCRARATARRSARRRPPSCRPRPPAGRRCCRGRRGAGRARRAGRPWRGRARAAGDGWRSGRSSRSSPEVIVLQAGDHPQDRRLAAP